MLSKNTTFTIVTKFITLLANFALVVFTTQVWGSEGRGEIALIFANISIISIISNIFCGSTVAYHTPRQPRNFLLTVSLAGALLLSLSGAIIFSALFGFRYFQSLFLIALLMSLTTAISSYWLGKNNIKNYNVLTLLNPLFILISLAALYFIFNKTTLDTFFKAYYLGAGIVLIIGFTELLVNDSFKFPVFNLSGIKSIFTYGINNEFNYFIQFLNYRLSYYFIAKLLGFAHLGVFSIVVSISEAVWIISRSMSAIHFSNVINSDDQLKNWRETIVFAKQSFWISILILSISSFIPRSLYQFIFGIEFGNVKKFVLYLLPGIVAITVSNLYGHYFAGIGKLKILRNKSLIGLGTTLIMLPLLITKYQLTGACIALNTSYLLSSIYLYYSFRKEGKSLTTGKNNQ
jgi:O-antigen/teichoic acid export membrane protein